MSVPPDAWDVADAGLLDALRQDDADAADRLVERYGDRVYRLAMRVIGSSDDAEAVARDTLRAVACGTETFTGNSAFASWIYRIAAGKAYQMLQARETSAETIALDTVLPAFDTDGRHVGPLEDWSKRVNDAAVQRALTAAINALPVDDRTALVLHDVEGLSNADIGAALQIDPRDLKSRVHRARLFLRKRLSEHLESA